jgi:hypothetical protein
VDGTSKFKPIDFLHPSFQDRQMMHVSLGASGWLSKKERIARSIIGKIVG